VGHRLSRIYTRTGDDGTTGLANGERVVKTDARIEAIGAVDETSSAVGLILAEDGVEDSLRDCLLRIQHDLFEIGAELSLPGYCGIQAAHIEHLESELDELNSALPPLKEFILPGGNRAAAACHLARTFCRRAERRAWAVSAAVQVDSNLLRYLNRLSDYLFVAARTLARRHGGSETLWQRERTS
jgi:cob(I)alamin adenosyltransferase